MVTRNTYFRKKPFKPTEPATQAEHAEGFGPTMAAPAATAGPPRAPPPRPAPRAPRPARLVMIRVDDPQ